MTLQKVQTLDTSPRNPADLGYPPTLPVEIVLKTAPLQEICEEYHLTREDWDRLRHDPVFVADLARTMEELKKDGVSFRLKARWQSEKLLQRSWQMIHDSTGNVPAAVAADLLKFTIRVAGLEPKIQDPNTLSTNNMSIQINLG